LVGVTSLPWETVSVVEVVDVEHDTGDVVDLGLVVGFIVVILDGAASHAYVVTLNLCTNLDLHSVFVNQHLGDMAAESSGRAKVLSAGVAVEFFDCVVAVCLMGPQSVAPGKISDELMGA
jgi:hypothetical protein